MSRLELFNYQKKASEFVQRIPRCILRLDTGLGKTAVCIDAAKRLPGVKRVLVIAPAFLKMNWLREIKMWRGTEKGLRGEEISWSIMSYSKLGRKGHLDKVLRYKWDMVICDEAHYLKNWEAKRTQNIVRHLLPRASRVVLSTATPFVRSAADLHPLFSTCEPGKWGKLRAFQERYCKKKPNHFKKWKKFDYYGANEKTVGELKTASRRFMISYKKKDVLSQLPDKIDTDIEIEVSKERLMDNLDLEEVIDVETGKISGGLQRILSRESVELGLDKLDVACEWLENLDHKEQVVIFCKHLSVQARIVEHLKKNSQSYHAINGEVVGAVRDTFVQQFQEGKVKYLVATMASCGVGINLTAASKCLFVELPWSYAELKQCEDRLHRIGQKDCV